MTTIIERQPIATALPYDLDALKIHFRVDHSFEDDLIRAMGATAAAELEDAAQVALLTQTIRLTIFAPRRDADDFLRLPIGPMAADTVPIVTIDGEGFTDFQAIPGNKPGIYWGETYTARDHDRVSIEYMAGFGTEESDVPRDLSMALNDQALMLYEARGATDNRLRVSSPHMARVASRYRGVRV